MHSISGLSYLWHRVLSYWVYTCIVCVCVADKQMNAVVKELAVSWVVVAH